MERARRALDAMLMLRAGGTPLEDCLLYTSCLAFTGGFLDAYTYLLRGGVFANAQTGTMVLMALYAAPR